jgi:hypothetical protein
MSGFIDNSSPDDWVCQVKDRRNNSAFRTTITVLPHQHSNQRHHAWIGLAKLPAGKRAYHSGSETASRHTH